MKKIAIPAILAATVLVAGIFAFMPVERASTVHTTIGTSAAKISDGVTLNGIVGTDAVSTIIAASSGFAFSGHFDFTTADTDLSADNTLEIRCEVSPGVNVILAEVDAADTDVSADFTCLSLTVANVDTEDDDAAVTFDMATQWTRSTATTVTT